MKIVLTLLLFLFLAAADGFGQVVEARIVRLEAASKAVRPEIVFTSVESAGRQVFLNEMFTNDDRWFGTLKIGVSFNLKRGDACVRFRFGLVRSQNGFFAPVTGADQEVAVTAGDCAPTKPTKRSIFPWQLTFAKARDAGGRIVNGGAFHQVYLIEADIIDAAGVARDATVGALSSALRRKEK